jgi:spore coat protein CotH
MLNTNRRNLSIRLGAGAVASLLVLGACSTGDTASSGDRGGAASASATGGGSGTTDTKGGPALFDDSLVHDIDVTFDQAAYEEMIDAFSTKGDKDWIEATITIDGVTYQKVGLRLKGNSSLMGLRNGNTGGGAAPAGNGARAGAPGGGPGGNVSADAPNGLPWLVRLDKYVDGQDHQGISSFVIRSNRSATSLNEAVALELIGLTGQATQKAFSTRFSVNGGADALRLAIENPDDDWEEENFPNDGVLYKAEAQGNYSYRGDDPSAYDEVFDQETDTDDENLKPLIAFLKFINESDDATFAAKLGDHLEIDAFATYLASQELVANFDDIDGPGNNSYLRYDEKTKRFTIVPWDQNLSFGSMGAGPGGVPGGGAVVRTPPPGGQLPTGPLPGAQVPGAQVPGAPLPGGAQGRVGAPGGGFNRTNILVQRFNANATFAAKVQAALATQKQQLFATGKAAEVLARWQQVLTEDASDLVPAATIAQEAAGISAYFKV